MKPCLLLVLLACTARLPASENPSAAKPWSPRHEIAPQCAVDPVVGRNGGGALRIQTTQSADYGGWRLRLPVKGGSWQNFSAWYRATNAPHERRAITARLEWLDAQGRALRPPDYAIDTARSNGWTRVSYQAELPPQVTEVDVLLTLGFSANSTVWWDDLELVSIPAPSERRVRAVTVFHRPRSSASAAASVESFCQLLTGAKLERPDIVCLPEGITVVGTGRSYAEVSEPLRGPTCRRLGELARQLGSYIVAGIYEREGAIIYNTALLLDRRGQLVGHYRKTHLPREEWEAGITPGDTFPVFDTDFGRAGLMICWDLQFPEAARALALGGAELILLPIWGGSEVLARARAIENCVFLISATYDMRSFIVDPAGAVLAEAKADQPVVSADLRLGRAIHQPWLGDMKTRTWKERRPDLPLPMR